MLNGTGSGTVRLPRGAAPLAVALLLVAMPVAPAQVKQFFASGSWSAYGGTAPGNRSICGIQTAAPNGGRLMIEQESGQTGLNLMLQKGSWSIPGSTPIALSFLFDGQVTFPGHGTGAGNVVTVTMAFQKTMPFMRAVRQDRQMEVSFPSGNEPPWPISLLGSGAVLNAFDTCRAGFAPATPTQPFAPAPTPAPTSAPAPAPTPPAGAPASPTQPAKPSP